MKLANIHATKEEVYLFLRKTPRGLDIVIDDKFYPYRFVEDPNGVFFTYDRKKVRKVYGDLNRIGRLSIYESDVNYTRQYLLDKVDKIDKAPIRYVFFDIEVLMDNRDNFDEVVKKALKPVSCISLYDNAANRIETLYIEDFNGKTLLQKEKAMLDKFITLINEIQPDLLLAWNVRFDYCYLYRRIKYKNLAECISPVGLPRWSGMEGIDFPIGISVLDYMEMYRKLTLNKANSYSLDAVLETELGKGKTHSIVEFGKLSKIIAERNREDVEGMVKLEEKLGIIDYYDAIRRISKCLWEDLPSKTDFKDGKVLYYSNNSKIIDMLCLQEARKMGIILPSKPKNKEKSDFQGAFREVFKTGLFNKPIQKLDLTSAYPTVMVDFCLDIQNIRNYKGENIVNINGIYFEQNPDTLLPRIASKLLKFKAELKEKLKKANPKSKQYKDLERMYASAKGIVNSLFGVIGLNGFRLFDVRIPSSVTFLVRDALKYVLTKLSEMGYDVVYVDTDSVMVQTEDDILDLCNNLLQKWGKEKYGKEKITIEFEKEGVFEKLFILAKCRYIGILNTSKGKLKEIKGIEMKRKDSSVYMKQFQEELFNYLFELAEKNIPNEKIENYLNAWVAVKIHQFFKQPLINIAFPVRYVNKTYKNVPVFIKALETSKIKSENFYNKVLNNGFYYYIYDSKNGAVAFDEEYENLIEEVDWCKMLERNILNKVKVIYEVMGFDMNNLYMYISKKFPDICQYFSKKVKKSLDLNNYQLL